MTVLIVERVLVVGAVALLLLGASAALLASNVAARLAGLGVAGLGALVALAALRVPEALTLAAAAILFAGLAVGVALAIRLQEAYGGIESTEIDAADAQSEPESPDL
jgi:multisubunit Na+/H+ antiporter MnhC subunit